MYKRITALFLAIALTLSFAACGQAEPEEKSDVPAQSQSEASLAPETMTPKPVKLSEPDESVRGEITVRDCIYTDTGRPSQLQSFAREFEKIYPNVTVNVEYYNDTAMSRKEIEAAKESYNTQVRMELVSGEADYILYFPTSGLNLYELSESGVLRDMRPYFDNDPDIDPNDYYTQVLDAVSVDGKLTTVPISFSLEGVYLNRKAMQALEVDLDAIDAVDCNDLLDWYDQGRTVQEDLEVLAGGWMRENFFTLEKPAYIDWATRTASFGSQEFVDFLERTGAITEENEKLSEISRALAADQGVADLALRSWDEGKNLFDESDTFSWDIVDKGHPAVAVMSGIGMPDLAHVTEPLDYLAGPYPAVTTKGELGVYSREDFAVPSSMKDPDLAWRFIAYCMRQRADMQFESSTYFTGYIPVNKHNVRAMLEEVKGSREFFYKETQAGYAMEDYDSQAGTQKLTEYLSRPLVNGKNYGVDMDEFLEEFYVNKLVTAQQCAEKIQGRAYIWLNE